MSGPVGPFGMFGISRLIDNGTMTSPQAPTYIDDLVSETTHTPFLARTGRGLGLRAMCSAVRHGSSFAGRG